MKTITVELANGYKAKVIEKSKTIIDEIWKEKIYEKDFIIEENMNVIDIGANQGFFSLYSANKGAKTISVEPEKNNYNILLENIKMNSLEDKIKAFKYAVSTKKGNIELFSPDFNEEYASGMVTTTQDFFKTTNRLNFNKIISQKVKCISLEELFNLSNFEHIDLLKIDCEGAEIDILKSAPKVVFQKINNIVMETHDTYSEKEIYHFVKDLGFNIVRYDKLTGILKTGYLFAENIKITKRNINEKPVTVLDMPSNYEVEKTLILDGSKSFSSINRENKLNYIWKINGETLENMTPKINYIFKHTGLNEIELMIEDTNSEKDIMKKNIYILKKNYYKTDDDVISLGKEGEEQTFEINKKMNFSLKIPKLWHPNKIIITIDYLTKQNNSAVLEFNNNKVKLIEDKNDFKLIGIPPDLEISFSIFVKEKEKFEINWWGMDNGKFRRSMILWMKKLKLAKNK